MTCAITFLPLIHLFLVFKGGLAGL